MIVREGTVSSFQKSAMASKEQMNGFSACKNRTERLLNL